jgi:nitrate/nitrite transporter NarK
LFALVGGALADVFDRARVLVTVLAGSAAHFASGIVPSGQRRTS